MSDILYDTKCFDLAEAFLEDEDLSKDELENHSDQLAKLIQKTIEDFIEYDMCNGGG